MSEEPQTGDQTEAAAQAEEVVSDTQDQEHKEQYVPLDALQAERAERQKLQDEMRMIKDYLTVMQSNQQKQSKPKDEFESLTDDDVLTVGEAKKFLKQRDSQYEMTIQELRMLQKYPDYSQVVTQYLPDVLKQNPTLRQSLEKTQDYELAYYLAKNSDAYKQSQKKEKTNADAERIVKNANRPGSLSSMGHTSPVNSAKRYKNMSDDEFRKLMAKHMG